MEKIMSDNTQELRSTPLYGKHLEAGARMVPFAGWNMPVQYTGIIEEHLHTRSKAGLFDICHMGEFMVTGESAGKCVERLVTCRVDDMVDGKCRYGFLLKEDGGIIDDLIVFKISPEEYMLVVNSGTISKDGAWIMANLIPGAEFEDISGKTAKLDIQGPLSGEVMAALAGKDAVGALKKYYFTFVEMDGVRVLLSRTGYTGELGYELFFPRNEAARIWDRLTAFDAVKPIGLGARDSLRLEMGYSLYGHDISEKRNPLEADLARFVYMEKDFIGKNALLRVKEKGPKELLAGFICEGRRAAREHYSVMLKGGKAGEVTSGGFSPCLKRGIGLCYIDSNFAEEGREIVLTDGKVEIKAEVRKIPLYRRSEK